MLAMTVKNTPSQTLPQTSESSSKLSPSTAGKPDTATTEIVKPDEIQKVYGFTREHVELIKRTVAKGASDDELQMFLAICHRKNLDPFSRQIHFTKRLSRALNAYVCVIITGIDGYRALAGRTGKYRGQDEPSFECDEKGRPVLARVGVYRSDFEKPIVGIARWNEFAPLDVDKPEAFFWKRMPTHMLAKCAEALALPKAFPEDFEGIYVEEEFARDVAPTIALPQRKSEKELTQGDPAAGAGEVGEGLVASHAPP